jgi:CHAD domain-containing protein
VVESVVKADYKTRGVSILIEDIKKGRNAEFARAQSTIDAARFRAFVLDVATWIETGDWMRSDNAQKGIPGKTKIAKCAAKQLNRHWKKMAKRGKHPDALSARQRHKLRIAAKRLRYASEFFADVFPGKKAARRRKRFVAGLKALQDCLGDLNDIAVNKRLSASLVDSPTSGELSNVQLWKAFTAGRLSGREEVRFSSVIKAATHAHKSFASARPLWN